MLLIITITTLLIALCLHVNANCDGKIEDSCDTCVKKTEGGMFYCHTHTHTHPHTPTHSHSHKKFLFATNNNNIVIGFHCDWCSETGACHGEGDVFATCSGGEWIEICSSTCQSEAYCKSKCDINISVGGWNGFGGCCKNCAKGMPNVSGKSCSISCSTPRPTPRPTPRSTPRPTPPGATPRPTPSSNNYNNNDDNAYDSNNDDT